MVLIVAQRTDGTTANTTDSCPLLSDDDGGLPDVTSGNRS
jgi:hypothetical protein